jgi:hypothetical protein
MTPFAPLTASLKRELDMIPPFQLTLIFFHAHTHTQTHSGLGILPFFVNNFPLIGPFGSGINYHSIFVVIIPMNRFPSWLLFICLFMTAGIAYGQNEAVYDTTIVHPDGRVMRIRISGTDTIIVATIPEVVIKAPPVFSNDEEYRQYMRYRRYAMDVLPYAIESIRMYRKYEAETKGMKSGQAKRYAKTIQQDAKDEFTEPLKTLSRTQGKILVKMIERHLNTSTYNILKDVRGGFNAMKWQTVGKLYGYDLKEGYKPGEDRILDMILNDFEITVE